MDIEQPEYSWDKSHNLILRYKYDFMPKGILTRLIMETHPWIESQKLVWKNGVVHNKNLDEIASGNDLQEIVFNLIRISSAEGWVEELICAAKEYNPGNSLLNAIVL